MSIHVDQLNDLVLSYAKASDEIIIISGYFSLDILEEIAKLGIRTTFYYGMYLRNGISVTYYNCFGKLKSTYPNLTIKIPVSYHVHTKCYVFKSNGVVAKILVGSANCSGSALFANRNSELLMPVGNSADQLALLAYADEIDQTSIHFDDPFIVPTSTNKVLSVQKRRTDTTPKSWNLYTGNPFSAIIPLYSMRSGKPEVQTGDGLNWGLGSAHHTSNGPYAEAAIPIRAFHINHYPTLIPYHGEVGSGAGGRITRRQGPIEVLWDDGTTMKMHFEGNGYDRPTPSNRTPDDPYRTYPKQLTTDNGGAELGEYLRKRLNIGGRVTITYADLIAYGRDYITFSLTSAGNYEIDFHS